MTKREVYAHLGQARKQKAAGDLDASAASLREAIALAAAVEETKLLATASWRLADLYRDSGRPEEMLEALDTVVAVGTPFAGMGGAKAYNVANETARKFWDFAGYDTHRLVPLFDALREHYTSNDPYMAAQADELAAWQHACRGDLVGMSALLDRYEEMTPKDFGTGRHRHTRVNKPGHSVFWVRMEIARSAVRMGAWMADEGIARRGFEIHQIASRKAGQRTAEFPHFLEATMVAALQFGWEEIVETCRADYDRSVKSWSGGRQDYHDGMHRAVTLELAGQRAEAAEAWRDVATISDEMHYGPEWVGDTLLRAASAAAACGQDSDADRWRLQAAEVIDEYGFEAMRCRLGS